MARGRSGTPIRSRAGAEQTATLNRSKPRCKYDYTASHRCESRSRDTARRAERTECQSARECHVRLVSRSLEKRHELCSRWSFTRTTNYCHQDFRGRSAFCPSDVQKENTCPTRCCICRRGGAAAARRRRPACARGRRADVLVVRRARARLTSGAASVEQTTTYSAVLVACMCMCTYARAHEHAQHARHLACERRTAAPMTAAVRSTRSTRFMQRGASSRAASSPPAGRTCRVVRPAAVRVRRLAPQGARATARTRRHRMHTC